VPIVEPLPKTRIKHLKRKRIPYIKLKERVIRPFNYSYLQKNMNRKKSIIYIFNDDNLCALRAILVGKSLVDLKKKLIKRLPTTASINKQVKEVCKKLKLPNKPMGIEEIKQVERYLKIYSVNVLEGRRGYATDVFLYIGPLNKYFIYILLSESHYNVLRSMKRTFHKNKFTSTVVNKVMMIQCSTFVWLHVFAAKSRIARRVRTV
jgi:hypothetical protein